MRSMATRQSQMLGVGNDVNRDGDPDLRLKGVLGRYRHSMVLVINIALAACSLNASNSPGSNGAAHGVIQAITESTPSTMLAAAGGARIGTSTGTQLATGSGSKMQISRVAMARLSITGIPAASTLVGRTYRFAPVVTGIRGVSPMFTIDNCPTWAKFDPATGILSGTPSLADIGIYSKISVSVTVGNGHVEYLPPFAISVTEVASGSATLTWDAPEQKSDGTPLTDLAGFRIYYGTDPDFLDQSVDVSGTSASSYTVDNLLPGIWYFRIQAYSSSNAGSVSATLSKQVM